MKHTVPVTGILLSIFLISQLFGLALVTQITPEDVQAPTNTESAGRGGALLIGILLGTIFLLAIIKYKLQRIWKAWFFIAVWLAMSYALGVLMPEAIAFALALGLAAWKIFKPNIIVHNLTEILVYSGIAVLVAASFGVNVLFAALLLLVISAYDAYAVWKSKHMVKMAEFQTESKLFAGLMVPYDGKSIPAKKNTAVKTQKKETGRTAVLGGGDIAFPLIFASAILQWLISMTWQPWIAYLLTLPVALGALGALSFLFLVADPDKFYPAMPFISAGCFIGFAVTGLLAVAL